MIPSDRKTWMEMMARELPDSPDRLTPTAQKRLSTEASDEYDSRRINFLCAEHLIHTPDLDHIMLAARKALIRNAHASYVARTGLALSGPSTVGKSSAILEIGRQHHRKMMIGNEDRPSFQPTVYVSFGIARTPKMALAAFGDFLGLGFSRTATITEIGRAVASVMNDLGTSLVIVDEVHNITGLYNRGADGAAGTLKWLTEHVNATFILAGIDLPATALFTGEMGTQFRGRFHTLKMEPYTNRSKSERLSWARLVGTLENHLLGSLTQHEVGTLAAKAEDIFAIPLESDILGAGPLPHSIGTLKDTLVMAAIDAIFTGKERVTVQDLRSQYAPQLAR